jgi:hypothetical protein
MCNKLLRQANVLAVQETHSTFGSAAAKKPLSGTRHRFSREGQTTAGVGLVIQIAFLSKFREVKDDDWVEVVPGRAAILQLDGPEGSLDLVVIYLHTGEARQQRNEVRTRLARALRPPEPGSHGGGGRFELHQGAG